MARTDAFLAALDAGARPDALEELLAAVERKQGADAHVRCVDAWAQKLVRDGADDDDIQWIRSRLALALENAATARGPRAAEFALEALRLHAELLDDPDGKTRVAALALMLAATDSDRVFIAVDAVGGLDAAVELLKREAKSPEVKSEPLRVAQVRRAISHLLVLQDDHEAAFFEALKVLRKAPFEPLYVDEALALALRTERNKEVSLVLIDLANDVSLPARLRANMHNKVGHLLERSLDDAPGALDAYVASLRLTPGAKGPRRHARRLAADLGLDFEMPEPLPEATLDEPAPASLLSWSSRDISETGAAVEPEYTAAEVPQGEFSTSAPLVAAHPPPLEGDSVDEAAEALPEDSGEFDDATLQFAGEENATEVPPTEIFASNPNAPTLQAPKAVTIPGSAAPNAPTAMELDVDLESMRGSDAAPASIPPALPFDDEDASAEENFFPPEDGDALEVIEEERITTMDSEREDASVDATAPPAASVAASDVLDNIGGGPTIADVPLPPGTPGMESSDDAEPPAGMSREGVALAALEQEIGDFEIPSEVSGVFFAPAAADAVADVEDKEIAKVNAAEIEVDDSDLDAIAKAALDDATEPPPVVEPELPPPSPPPRGGKRTKEKTSRKQKKRERKQARSASNQSGDSVLPGMRPEDLLPHRTSTSPGRRAPVLANEVREPTVQTASELTLATPVPGPGDVDIEPTLAEPAPVPSLATSSHADAAPREASDINEPEAGARDVTVQSAIPSELADPPSSSEAIASAEAPKEFVVAAPAVVTPLSSEELTERALASDDANACLDLAQELTAAQDSTDRALRLVTQGMVLQMRAGLPSDFARLLFLDVIRGNEAMALDAALKVKAALGEDAPFLTDFFVDVATRTAPLEAAAELLETLALVDAPHGRAFEQLDAHYISRDEPDARLRLWERARVETAEGKARRAIDLGRLSQLKTLGRDDAWRALHAELALETPHDEDVRDEAVQAWASAPEKDRARFYGRLALALGSTDAGIDLYRQTLALRLQTRDDLGAEAAARELLKARPGDRGGLLALTEVLSRAPHRFDDLVEVLRTRRSIGGNTQDVAEISQTGRELYRLHFEKRDIDSALRDLATAVELASTDDALNAFYLDALEGESRWRDLLGAIDALAPTTEDDDTRRLLWLRAASIAKEHLDDLPHARLCVERALEIAPRDTGALLLRADLAVAAGDADEAYHALERVAGELQAGAERAAIYLRMGFLLEDELERPADALKRYRAAADADSTLSEAFAVLRAVALKENAFEHLKFALKGLIRLERVPTLRAALRKQLARLLEDQGDVVGAQDELRAVLEDEPGDQLAQDALLDLVSERLGFASAKVALASPTDAFVSEVAQQLGGLLAVDSKSMATLTSFEVRRVFALAHQAAGDDIRARGAFERLLDERPTDAVSLRALAKLLAVLSTDDADARRLSMLEQLLLHHGPTLSVDEQVRTWSDVCLLRRNAGIPSGALLAARRAFSLASDDDLRAAIDTAAAEAAVAVLEHGVDETDARLLISAHRLLASRESDEAGAERLAEAAAIAEKTLDDRGLARQLLEHAVKSAPQLLAPREALLQLDIREGDPDKAIETTETLLATESDRQRRAGHHLRLSKLYLRARDDAKSAAEHLRQAIELDPENATALDDAEVLFAEQQDALGLEALYTAQLSGIPLEKTHGRYQLLERLAQVRRYDLRDLAGAVEALEAMGAIDPVALKPREDAARIYSELGRWKEATTSWRAVLERDPLHPDAWRGLSSLYARTEQADETFAVASAMSAVELAADDVTRAVRTIRPPFPRWPKVPGNLASVRQRLSHELERAPVRSVFDVCGRRLFRVFARPLKEFGVRKKDQLSERDVPGSVNLAVRVTSQLLGLKEPPRLVRAELGATDGAAPPFALLPAPEPGLIITDDVIKGGMTPERAFALGRAMAWLTPHGLLAGSVDVQTLRNILEALVHVYVPGGDVEGDGPQVREMAKKISASLEKGLGPKDVVTLRKNLSDALRSYVHARSQRPLNDWLAGVAYSGDRLGFLLCGDLLPSFRVLQEAAGQSDHLGARLAIRELVLFSVSADYLSLRRDLGLALNAGEADALYDLL